MGGRASKRKPTNGVVDPFPDLRSICLDQSPNNESLADIIGNGTLLGQGAHGAVYKFKDYAYKVIPEENEAKIMAYLELVGSSCPIVLPCLEACWTVSTPEDLVIMKERLIQGKPLSKYMDNRLSPEQRQQTLIDVSQALVYIAERGLVHSDVKPDNIMIRLSATKHFEGATLIDLDVACAPLPDTMETCGFQGTMVYLPPETFAEKMEGVSFPEAVPKRDVWALGCVTFQLATGGALPFATDSEGFLTILRIAHGEKISKREKREAYRSILDALMNIDWTKYEMTPAMTIFMDATMNPVYSQRSDINDIYQILQIMNPEDFVITKKKRRRRRRVRVSE